MKARTKSRLLERGYLLNWVSSCSTGGRGTIRDAAFASTSPATPSRRPDRVLFEIQKLSCNELPALQPVFSDSSTVFASLSATLRSTSRTRKNQWKFNIEDLRYRRSSISKYNTSISVYDFQFRCRSRLRYMIASISKFTSISKYFQYLNALILKSKNFDIGVLWKRFRYWSQWTSLSVLKSHFKTACIGPFNLLYRLCERRFVRAMDLQKNIASRKQSMMALGKRWFGFRRFKKALARLCY